MVLKFSLILGTRSTPSFSSRYHSVAHLLSRKSLGLSANKMKTRDTPVAGEEV